VILNDIRGNVMAEPIFKLLNKYKGSEYNVLKVSIYGENNINQHLVIRINKDGYIKIEKCTYVKISEVKAFLDRRFPTTEIVER
jgi:hypothetical protein